PGVGAHELVPGRLLRRKGIGLVLKATDRDTRHALPLHNPAINSALKTDTRRDHIIGMRKVLPVLLLLAVAACGTPARWEKPGVTDEVVASDMTACRQAAVQEANRYPFG